MAPKVIKRNLFSRRSIHAKSESGQICYGKTVSRSCNTKISTILKRALSPFVTLLFNTVKQEIEKNLYCLVVDDKYSMLKMIACFSEMKFLILNCRPDYAPAESSDSEEELEFGLKQNQKVAPLPKVTTEAEKEDRRLRRLQERRLDDDDEDDDRDER